MTDFRNVAIAAAISKTIELMMGALHVVAISKKEREDIVSVATREADKWWPPERELTVIEAPEYQTIALIASQFHLAARTRDPHHKSPRDCTCHKEAVRMYLNTYEEYSAYLDGRAKHT